jgi:predicted ATPase/DNA-binding CsgD family transcriptional regulator
MCAARVTATGTALTAREIEVLDLVRQRLTNLEIAGRLSVSVRTVETHVSALLRKVGVDDRRALGQQAIAPPAVPRTGTLPTMLTQFVGRVAELEDLCSAVLTHRLVVATGPGGVGKTRLALAAAESLSASFVDGCVFVDLVRVVQPAVVIAAVADACGALERAGASREQALIAALADRELLLVVDNCEHVQDAARTTIERLLRACPGVRVLATSRLRLMLPFERVVPVAGLSLATDGGPSDAVTLFLDRMTAAGARAPTHEADLEVVRRICEGLDGMALSIELAAARAPSLGLDGLLSALSSNLQLLSVGSRADDRHRSLHAAIDWSYDLLDRDAQQTLRAAAVFAGPFDLDAVCAVVALPRSVVLGALASLVDWNLITLRSGRPDRYGVLETIRQYAFSREAFEAEGLRLRARHGEWCHFQLAELLERAPGDDEWCAEVDAIFDEARAALAHLTGGHLDGGHQTPGDLTPDGAAADHGASFAGLLADVAFQRGRPGEAQRWYEDAAAMTEPALSRRRWLHLAAGAAAARNVGAETVDLLVQAARLATAAGRPDDASTDLANAAGMQFRAPGIVQRVVDTVGVEDMLRDARAFHRGGAEAAAAMAIAEGWAPNATARSRAATERALHFAELSGEALLLDEALDQMCALQLGDGDMFAAAATIDRRLEVLSAVQVDPLSGFEHYDSLHMACQVNLAMGRLGPARRFADAITALPFLRQERHLGLGRRLGVDALAGDFPAAVSHAELFEQDWRRAGRPVVGNLAVGAYAAAMVLGMLGDEDARTRWIAITKELLSSVDRLHTVHNVWRAVLDGLLALHRDDLAGAVELLSVRPGAASKIRTTAHPLWESWYAAAWAETAVLTGDPDAMSRVLHARELCRANEIALAIVDRAAALHEGRIGDLDAITGRLTTLGCTYQADRTRVLATRAGAPGGADHGVPGATATAQAHISVDPTQTKDR